MPEQNQEPKPYGWWRDQEPKPWGWWREEQYSYGGIYQFLITKCLDYDYYLSFSNNPKKVLANEGFILDDYDSYHVRDWVYENLDDRKKELWWNDDDFQSLLTKCFDDGDYAIAFFENHQKVLADEGFIVSDNDSYLMRQFVTDCLRDRREEQYKMEVERGEHWEPTSLFDWIKVIAGGILALWLVMAFLSGAGG